LNGGAALSLAATPGHPSWEKDGRDWPNRETSRFVEVAGLRWHIQRSGRGPALLLVHGTGAATHSWRDLAPLLASRFSILAPDLPGHGFTDPMPSGSLSLSGIARALHALLRRLEFAPDVVVGHSAGAAILARMCIDRTIAPKLLVGLNAALLPFDGVAGHFFPPIAKMLFLNPLAPRLFAWSTDRIAVTRLLRGTGSTIDRAGVDLYARLMGHHGHVAGALGMMANWDLETLARDLPKIPTPMALIVARGDKAVPPSAADRIRTLLPQAQVEFVGGVGHLAHEEKPELICDRIFTLAEAAGAIAPA
jgi:magnesium chelatase accessory protein